jgi:hypothetical protein
MKKPPDWRMEMYLSGRELAKKESKQERERERGLADTNDGFI